MHYIYYGISRADAEGNPIHLALPEERKDVKYDLLSAVGCVCVCARACSSALVHTCVHAWYFSVQAREVWHTNT